MFFQLDLYPVSAHSSGSRMSTSTNPLSRWSFTSAGGILDTEAVARTLDRPAARTTAGERARTARGATAVLKDTDEAATADISRRGEVEACGRVRAGPNATWWITDSGVRLSFRQTVCALASPPSTTSSHALQSVGSRSRAPAG